MNSRTELLNTAFRPELSIIVYKTIDTENFGRDNYYLESHQINEQGQVMEGKPLLEQTLQGLMAVMQRDQKDRSILNGVVPANLLFYKPIPAGKYNIAWYRPAEVRFFHFAQVLKLKLGKMWAPAMLYYVESGSLHVYALKKDDRPIEKTQLMRGPFHNVADDGKVCLGNADVKKPLDKSFISALKYWEDLFWLSEFAHLNGAANPTISPLADVYKKLLASKEKIKWSDIKELKPSKRQIKSILQ
jgi:PRTRC genetic system protein B